MAAKLLSFPFVGRAGGLAVSDLVVGRSTPLYARALGVRCCLQVPAPWRVQGSQVSTVALDGPARTFTHLASIPDGSVASRRLPAIGMLRTTSQAAAPSPSASPPRASIRPPSKPVRKDPERPTRPETPWLGFLRDYRTQHVNLKAKELMRAAAAEWKVLDATSRRRWVEPYEAKKKIYDAEFKAYRESGKLDAWQRDPDRPKKPMSGYFHFVTEFRAGKPNLKLTECAKMAGVAWKNMSAEARAPYEQKYAAEHKKYKDAMVVYEASGKEQAWKERVGIAEVERKIKARVNKVKAASAKTKASLAKRKAGAAKKKAAAVTKKKAALAKKKAALAKKKASLAKKKAAAAKKKAAAAAKKKAAIAKKNEALAKKRAAAAKKKMADAKKKAVLAKKKEAGAAKKKMIETKRAALVAKKKLTDAKKKMAATKSTAHIKKIAAAKKAKALAAKKVAAEKKAAAAAKVKAARAEKKLTDAKKKAAAAASAKKKKALAGKKAAVAAGNGKAAAGRKAASKV